MKPKFKDIYKPIVRIENKIRIGFESQVLEIDDEDKSIEKFISALDGSNNVKELSTLLALSVKEIQEGTESLNEFNLLENTESITTLTINQRERYRANLNYFSNFSNLEVSNESIQEKLLNSKVAILGIGGSSLIAASLAGMGIGKLIGLDYDIVELSNLNRQFLYSEEDIGKLKTQAAEERLRKINSELEIVMHNLKVTKSSELLRILEEVDFVINGIDQPPIMSSRWINSACTYLNKPFLQGGVTNSRIVLQKIIPENSCFDCYLINSLQNVEGFENQLINAIDYNFSGRNTAYAPNISLMAGLFSSEVSKYLLSQNRVGESSFTLDINNVNNIEYNKYLIDKVDCCPTCANKNTFQEPIPFNELVKISKFEGVTL